MRLPRRTVGAKFVVLSSYTHTPSSMDIATGPHAACVVELVFQARWGAPLKRDQPWKPHVFDVFPVYMPAHGRLVGAQIFRNIHTNVTQPRVRAKGGFASEYLLRECSAVCGTK